MTPIFANAFKGKLGDTPTHDKSVQDVVDGAQSFSQTTIKMGFIVAVVVGVCLFLYGLYAIRHEETRIQGIWAIICGGLLAIASTAYAFIVGGWSCAFGACN